MPPGEVRVSGEQPKSPPPAKPPELLKDLPAQPVDEKEAKGVKGGTNSIQPTNATPR